MKRKVIKQGHNTLTVTLPSKWVNMYGINPGDELDVSENEKTLIISSEDIPRMSKTTIDVSGIRMPIVIWRCILSAYRAGYDEIIVTGIEPSNKKLYSPFTFNTLTCIEPDDMAFMSPIETVSACVNRLIGMEIVEHKGNYCMIKDLSETTYKEFDTAIRRIFILLGREAEIISEGLMRQFEDLKSIHIIDTNIDRFEDFCLRVLNKKGYKDFRKSSTIYSMVFTMEMVGDELKKIATHVLEMNKKCSPEIKELFRVQSDQLEKFHSLFYKFGKKKIQEIYDEDSKGTKLIMQHYNKLSDDEKELLHHFKKIGIYILSLTELVIDMNF